MPVVRFLRCYTRAWAVQHIFPNPPDALPRNCAVMQLICGCSFYLAYLFVDGRSLRCVSLLQGTNILLWRICLQSVLYYRIISTSICGTELPSGQEGYFSYAQLWISLCKLHLWAWIFGHSWWRHVFCSWFFVRVKGPSPSMKQISMVQRQKKVASFVCTWPSFHLEQIITIFYGLFYTSLLIWGQYSWHLMVSYIWSSHWWLSSEA